MARTLPKSGGGRGTEEQKDKVLVTQLCVILCDPMDCSPPGSSVRGSLEAKILEWLPCLPYPRIKPRSPALQADSLLSESPGKPKNTKVGSLYLLQGILPTQESNWSLLHCRQILYQLSYQGNPKSKGRSHKTTKCC